MLCLWLIDFFRFNNKPLLNESQDDLPIVQEIEYTHIKN